MRRDAMMAAWDVDGLDCRGGIESAVASIVEWGLKLLVGWTPCPTEENPEALCPVYVGPTFEEQTRIPGPGHHSYPMPLDPPVGSVAYLEVTMMDFAGNLDTDPCP